MRAFTDLQLYSIRKYGKQDQQGKAAFNERNPHMTQQQEVNLLSPISDSVTHRRT
jgi:hypothetical protein